MFPLQETFGTKFGQKTRNFYKVLTKTVVCYKELSVHFRCSYMGVTERSKLYKTSHVIELNCIAYRTFCALQVPFGVALGAWGLNHYSWLFDTLGVVAPLVPKSLQK